MRILMFGWEYPPRFAGGLGVASQGLVRGLLAQGAEILLVLPRHPGAAPEEGLTLLDANEVLAEWKPVRSSRLEIFTIETPLEPYAGEEEYARASARIEREKEEIRVVRQDRPLEGGYGRNLQEEVRRYAQAAQAIAAREKFDVIHAHDWMTYVAGLEAQAVSGRPLVVHVHATEFDRTGGSGSPLISAIERKGMTGADRVICVSRYTAGVVRARYGVPESRIRIVYNAIDGQAGAPALSFEPGEPVVLFAGRLTFQKGPEYFIEAARLVLGERSDVKFVLAGAGDMLPVLLTRVADLGLGHRILFTGFLESRQLDLLYRRADVYVMPSVSEPFGLTVLEALRHGVPVIVSRHAGVAEVVRHALKVDFWDVPELASKILSVLNFAPLRRELRRRGRAEIRRLSWSDSALRCLAIYREIRPSIGQELVR
jgi:glycogen synthase